MLTVLGGLAEFERELIRARTDDGREIARAVSAENERVELLARAQAWDLIADRIRGIG